MTFSATPQLAFSQPIKALPDKGGNGVDVGDVAIGLVPVIGADTDMEAGIANTTWTQSFRNYIFAGLELF